MTPETVAQKILAPLLFTLFKHERGALVCMVVLRFISWNLPSRMFWSRGKINWSLWIDWRHQGKCFGVRALVHMCVFECVVQWERKRQGGCSGAPVHVPVTGCRLRGSSTGLALGHLAAKERCPSWSRSNWIEAIGLATWKLSFSFINTQITSDILCHPVGPLNGRTVKLKDH